MTKRTPATDVTVLERDMMIASCHGGIREGGCLRPLRPSRNTQTSPPATEGHGRFQQTSHSQKQATITASSRKADKSPRVRLKTPWSKPRDGTVRYHAWTDGSYREAAGLGWLITADSKGEGPAVAEGARNLGGQQTAFDAETAAIEQVVKWFLSSNLDHRHMTIHSDSTSAIARAGHPQGICGLGKT
jgi:hypothetical protein